MEQEEVLLRLSDVITFYIDTHRNPQNKKEEKDIEKDIKACEIAESILEANPDLFEDEN